MEKGVCEKRSVENIGDVIHNKVTKKRRVSRRELKGGKPNIVVKVDKK